VVSPTERSPVEALRGEVYWVTLDPTVGTEIRKTRPCLIITPNDMNAALPRIIVAPITSKGQALGCRPEITLNGQTGRILLDQLRSIDKQRLGKKMGEIPVKVWLPTLLEMFAE
jgi:mRNA interferase MazF